ncbi:synaptophysin-like protein 1 [Protopterus annectens]|uniref:synaptophysin-like protein 1 n=1 Tax=Protopterus annectens TaxID=7888 RepID=UPI001CFBFFEF|nr:synaptophysin-like protein 1 [Protopterus annectens]
MAPFHLSFDPLKEPIGFIKVLEWVFAIFAFATCGGYTGSTIIETACKNKTLTPTNGTLTAVFSYPFRLHKSHLKLDPSPYCNYTESGTLYGDYSSSAEFFVSIAVFAFLYSMGALVYYIGYLNSYRNSKKPPIVDFGFTVLFTFMWLVSSSAWAKGLADIKIAAAGKTIMTQVEGCKILICTEKSATSFAKLNVSAVCIILSLDGLS